MTVQRILRWTCDTCGAQAEREGYGFPAKGWSVIPSNPRVRNAPENKRTLNECPECTKRREEESAAEKAALAGTTPNVRG